jgi:DNA gyrase/topoisomerase IV subunit B
MKDIKSKALLTNKEITEFLLVNTDYLYYLNNVANTYAIEPYLLEMILNHYVVNKDSINVDKLQKEIKSVYRFMDVKKVKNTVLVEGVIGKYNIVSFGDKLVNDCRYILDIIRQNKALYYNVNGTKSSIYEIMNLYDKTSPSAVQRFKGLGEMDKEELAESTLYPGSDRTLVRYTMRDAKEELEEIREYESDTKKILNLVGNVTRDDLLD